MAFDATKNRKAIHFPELQSQSRSLIAPVKKLDVHLLPKIIPDKVTKQTASNWEIVDKITLANKRNTSFNSQTYCMSQPKFEPLLKSENLQVTTRKPFQKAQNFKLLSSKQEPFGHSLPNTFFKANYFVSSYIRQQNASLNKLNDCKPTAEFGLVKRNSVPQSLEAQNPVIIGHTSGSKYPGLDKLSLPHPSASLNPTRSNTIIFAPVSAQRALWSEQTCPYKDKEAAPRTNILETQNLAPKKINYQQIARETREKKIREKMRKRVRQKWKEIFEKVVVDRRKRRARVYELYESVIKELLKKHYLKRDGVVSDQYGVLIKEINAVLHSTWGNRAEKKTTLKEVFSNISQKHEENVKNQFAQTRVSSKVYTNLNAVAWLF